MKTLTSRIILTVIFILSISTAKAEFAKTIHKSWPLQNVKALSVDNKFGNINFISNRDDSVTIDVRVEIDISEKKAEFLAEQIEFNFSISDGIVYAKTEFGDKFKTNQDFSIVYTINIPTDRHLNVENKYGDVTLGDLKAKGKFEIKYGNIHGLNLNAPDDTAIQLELKYGNASFDAINRLKAEIGYSKVTLGDLDETELDTQYSIIKTGTVNSMVAESKYDNYKIETIGKLNAESKFTNWNMGTLQQILDMENEYGNIDVDAVSEDFEQIELVNSYGTIRFGIPASASYQLEVESYYCSVKHYDAHLNKHTQEHNRKYIKGYVGTPNTTALVKIESRYGKVNLTK